MNIKLRLGNKEEEFEIQSTGKHFRQLLEFDNEIDYTHLKPKDIDKLVELVCDAFGGQFTVDEFYNGITSYEITKILTDAINFIRTGKTTEEINEDYNELLKASAEEIEEKNEEENK